MKTNYNTNKNNFGFTLAEISIVLLIIGLIIGGIIVGKDMIVSAEIRRAISEVNSIKIAINTFKVKYAAIPGDIKNATDYWPLTSNGDGNGIFSTMDSPKNEEGGYLWHHLGLAGMYKTFARPNNSNFSTKYGKNTPSILPNTAATGQNRSSYTYSRYRTRRNYLQVGNFITDNSGKIRCGDSISHMLAYLIDVKMDDGVPSSGEVFAYTTTSGCTTSSPISTCTAYSGFDYDQPPGTVQFDMNKVDSKCRMAFLLNT